MHVFLPGGTGFFGRATQEHLFSRGHTVLVGGRSKSADVVVDVTQTDSQTLTGILDDIAPDAILNFVGAGLSDPSASPALLNAANANWPSFLADYVRASDGVTLLHVASSTEMHVDKDGNFESAYSASKALGSQNILALHDELPDRAALVYAHNIYGPTQPETRFVRWLAIQATSNSPVNLAYPLRIRDFLYIDDAAASLASGFEDLQLVHRREVGTGIGTSLRDVAYKVFRALGSDTDLINESHSGENDPFMSTVADPDNLLRLPSIDLDEGLQRTINSMREQRK